MLVRGQGTRLGELAQQIVDVMTRLTLAMPRPRRRTGGLKEVEFLTLSILRQRGSLIVGDIQRQLGVLPAQMSRIIRGLESRDRPLISCRINPNDKRKIDVALTAAGAKAFEEFQTARLHGVTEALAALNEEDLDDLQRVTDKIQDAMAPRE